MKTVISRVLVVLAFLALTTTGCATGTGFRPGAGERVLDTTLKGAIVGTVVGLGAGVLSEVFNGGGDDRRGVVVRDGHGHSGYGRYNSPAEAVNARRYRQQQWEEEERRLDAIHAGPYHHRR